MFYSTDNTLSAGDVRRHWIKLDYLTRCRSWLIWLFWYTMSETVSKAFMNFFQMTTTTSAGGLPSNRFYTPVICGWF